MFTGISGTNSMRSTLKFTDTNFEIQKQPLEVFLYKKAVLQNFAIFTGKHLCWCLILIKFQAFRYFEKHLRTVASVVFPAKRQTMSNCFTASKMSVFGAFLVRIFSPLFSPNEGKYGLEKLQIRTLFLFLFFQNKFDVDLVYIVVTYLALQ